MWHINRILYYDAEKGEERTPLPMYVDIAHTEEKKEESGKKDCKKMTGEQIVDYVLGLMG